MVLFGSRAHSNHRERSDIDLAVYGLTPTQAGRMRLALEELPTLLEFDLVCVDEHTAPALPGVGAPGRDRGSGFDRAICPSILSDQGTKNPQLSS